MSWYTTHERRSHPRDPASWLVNSFGGSGTSAGVTVTEESALSATAIFAGVRLIAETLASLPFRLYRRIDERQREQVSSHPVARLLDAPNGEQTPIEFFEMQQGLVPMWGNAYAEIVRDGAGRIEAVWPIVPWRVRLKRDEATKLLIYWLLPPGEHQWTPRLADDIWHVRGFSSDGLLGDRAVERFKEMIGLTLAAEKFGASLFGRGSMPSGVLTHPGQLSREAKEKLREDWQQKYGGLTGAHRVAILEEGLQWTQVSTDPEKAQALETRKYQVAEAARILNLPPHLLRDLEHATFSNIEEQSIEFVVYSMRPHFVRWEQRANRSLLTDQERAQGHYTKIVDQALLRGNSEQRSKFYREMWGIGALSINDILGLEDRNPVEGGDQRFVPLNMVPLDLAAQMAAAATEPEPADEPEDPDTPEPNGDDARSQRLRSLRQARSVAARRRHQSSIAQIVERSAARSVRREVAAARRALDRAYGGRDTIDLRVWMDEFYERHAHELAEELTPTLRALAEAVQAEVAAEIGGDTGLTPALERSVRTLAAALGRSEGVRHLEQLRAILRDQPPESAEEALRACLAAWESSWAAGVAVRVVRRAGNAIARECYGQLGVRRIAWLAGETCTQCPELAGRTVAIDAAFAGGVLHPPLYDGCDCMIAAA